MMLINNLNDSNSIEIVNFKMPSLILYMHFQKDGQRLQVYHYKIAHNNTFT